MWHAVTGRKRTLFRFEHTCTCTAQELNYLRPAHVGRVNVCFCVSIGLYSQCTRAIPTTQSDRLSDILCYISTVVFIIVDMAYFLIDVYIVLFLLLSFFSEIPKRRVGVCIAITIVLILAFVFFVFTLDVNRNAYLSLSTQATMSVSASVGVMAHGIQSAYHTFALSFTGWDVRLRDSNQHDQSLVVYCAAYNISQLNNNRYFKNLSSDDTFVKLNRTFQPGRYPLPISLSIPLYLLESSQVFVNVCPSASNPECSNSFHKMTFLVFNDQQARDHFVDKNSSSPVAYKEEITIEDGGVCQKLSITINRSTLVYFAFSTADVICIKELSGSIHQRLYSAEGLDLKNGNNELIDGKIYVKGNASSHLVCVAPNSEELDELCVNNRLVFNGWFFGLIVLCVLIIILFVFLIIILFIFICCGVGWCRFCKMFARKRENNRYTRCPEPMGSSRYGSMNHSI